MNLGAAVERFWNEKQGQSLLFPPNKELYRGQCVQPVMFYMRDYLSLPVLWYGTAAEYRKGGNGYTYVVNRPNDPNQIPPKGAIIIWNASLSGTGGAGHIALFWQNNAGAHTFVSVDSNWGGKTVNRVTHSWVNVDGWLLPAAGMGSGATNTSTGDEMIANEEQARQAYRVLRPNGGGSDAEIKNTAGKRTWWGFAKDAQPEINARDAAFRDQTNVINSQRDTINKLNQTITNLNTEGVEDDRKLQESLSKISDLTAQLTTAHDQIADLQTTQSDPLNTNKPPVLQNEIPATDTTVPASPKLTLFQNILLAVVKLRNNKKA